MVFDAVMHRITAKKTIAIVTISSVAVLLLGAMPASSFQTPTASNRHFTMVPGSRTERTCRRRYRQSKTSLRRHCSSQKYANVDYRYSQRRYARGVSSRRNYSELFVSAENGEGSSDSSKNMNGQGIPSSMFSLIKTLVGSAVLTLPYGVATIGDVPKALIPSTALVFALGTLSAYSYFTIGRICEDVGDDASTLSEIWEKEVSPKTSWLISLSCFVLPFGANLAYSIILGDLFSNLAKSAVAGYPSGVVARAASSRPLAIASVTLLALYPLCRLKSLASLSGMSLVGVGGILGTAAFMFVRLVRCSYRPGSVLVESLSAGLRPSFDRVGVEPFLTNPAGLILGSMLALSYVVHFSAPDFYRNLKDNNMKRFGCLTFLSFFCTAVINTLIMSFGFLTFGGNCSGMILNNYSVKDVGATFCRLLIGISLIGSYPLLFSAMRNEFMKYRYKGNEPNDIQFRNTTRLLLAVLTGLSLLLKNAGFVVSLNGAIMGSAIIYIFPSVIYLKSIERRLREGSVRMTKRIRVEKMFNKLLIAFGVFSAGVGAAVTVLETFFPAVLP